MDEKDHGIQLLTEYFKSLREEIHIRIREHTRLVWIKIVTLGIIISFTMKSFYAPEATSSRVSTTSHLLYLVWIIPLTSIIFDMLIASNLRVINNLGYYIRKYLEEKLFRKYVDDTEFSFWEEVAGQGSPKLRCYTKWDVVVIWLFTLASGAFSCLLRKELGFDSIDKILCPIFGIGIIFALRCLILSLTMERKFFIQKEIGGVPNLRWNKLNKGIMESKPSLGTAGYKLSFLQIPPNTEYELKGGEFIICLLRGAIISEKEFLLRKSLLLERSYLLKSGDDGCLLFLCKDEGDNKKYKDEISGLKIEWSEYDSNMYRTKPQIHVDKYRINLWYLGPNKHGGIHNHSHEPIPFVEFHTQLRGSGWMVKYEDKEGKNEIEKVKMTRGYTHDLFCDVKDKEVVYPWHEYIAGEEGSLFIVFEDTKELNTI